MSTWLFNPFTYIAGLKSLLIGWTIMLLTAFVAYYSTTHFDGAIDIHVYLKPLPVWYSLAEQLIAWGSLVFAFYPGGRSFSASSVRFIDVAGTTALARAPMLLVAILNLAFPNMHDYTKFSFAFFLILAQLACEIWMIALLYNAFKVSCNLKGSKATGLFIVALIMAEIISKVILHFVYLSLK